MAALDDVGVCIEFAAEDRADMNPSMTIMVICMCCFMMLLTVMQVLDCQQAQQYPDVAVIRASAECAAQVEGSFRNTERNVVVAGVADL